jgi:hypothetical protein
MNWNVDLFAFLLYTRCGRNCDRGVSIHPLRIIGIATGYGLDGPGIESRWGVRFSALVQAGPGAHPAPVQWVPGLSRGKRRPGRDADPSPPPSTVVMKEQSYTSSSHVGRTSCAEPQCLY